MPILSLDEIKAHLRLDGEAEDAHLTLLSEAAEDYVSQYLDRPVPWLDAAGSVVPVPGGVRAALLLIVGDLYENREGQITGVSRAENPTVMCLLSPYRTGLGV